MMTETKVEQIAEYAYRAKFEDLSEESRKQIPVHILDCLSCQIAALGADPINACKEQVEEFSPSGDVPLIASGNANPLLASFWHTALVRYVDVMDNILAPNETAHTADNFGGVLTAAAINEASGKELILGVAVSWSIQTLLVQNGNFMTRGLDHTAQLAFSVSAAAGRLMGLDKNTIANGIAMAAASDASFAGIRSKPLSEWKGLASAQSTQSAFNVLYLAKRGVKGPLAIVEGPKGIEQLLGKPIDVDWSREGYEGVTESTIKKYVAMIHTQSAIECMMQLINKEKVDASKIESINAEVPQITYDFAGGGAYGDAGSSITTKEQADHSLPYLLAVAVLDGQVMQPQFTKKRIVRDDVQTLLTKVHTQANDEFTKKYPQEFYTRIKIKLSDGSQFEHEISDYPGMPSHPFTWEDAVNKFDQMTEGYIEKDVADQLKAVVKDLENHTTNDLFDILTKIDYPMSN